MTPSNWFAPRYENQRWQPPRPHYSSVLIPAAHNNTTGRWYEYLGGVTSAVQPPEPGVCRLYKEYSFYHNDGIIYIYPDDAVEHQVGDGTGNEPRVALPTNSTPDDSDDSSDDEEANGSRRTRNWRELSFNWLGTGRNYSSSATFEAPGVRLDYQRVNEPWVRELIPPRYYAPTARRISTAPPWCGLTGELPILIALIAFSVRQDQVDRVLRHSIQTNYRAHGLTPGQGCRFEDKGLNDYADLYGLGTQQRGLVVRVYCEARSGPDHRAQRGQPALSPQGLAHSFETGLHARHGNFCR